MQVVTRGVRILSVKPADLPSDPIKAHLAMVSFVWKNESTFETGESSREEMYTYIVNGRGDVYIKRPTGEEVAVYGAVTSDGARYIRAADGNGWTNDLVDLEKKDSGFEASSRDVESRV